MAEVATQQQEVGRSEKLQDVSSRIQFVNIINAGVEQTQEILGNVSVAVENGSSVVLSEEEKSDLVANLSNLAANTPDGDGARFEQLKDIIANGEDLADYHELIVDINSKLETIANSAGTDIDATFKELGIA